MIRKVSEEDMGKLRVNLMFYSLIGLSVFEVLDIVKTVSSWFM